VNGDIQIKQALLQFEQGCLKLTNSGSYADEEIELCKGKNAEITIESDKLTASLEEKITGVEQRFAEQTDEKFITAYKLKFEEVSMKHGFGQKFGLPKRVFNRTLNVSRFNEEKTEEINQSLKKCVSFRSKSRVSASELLEALDHLRLRIYNRAAYLSCLPPKPDLPSVKYDREDGEKIPELEKNEPFQEIFNTAFEKWKKDIQCVTKKFYAKHKDPEILCSPDDTSAIPEPLRFELEKENKKWGDWLQERKDSLRKQAEKMEKVLRVLILSFLQKFPDSKKQQIEKELEDFKRQLKKRKDILQEKFITIINEILTERLPTLTAENGKLLIDSLQTTTSEILPALELEYDINAAWTLVDENVTASISSGWEKIQSELDLELTSKFTQQYELKRSRLVLSWFSELRFCVQNFILLADSTLVEKKEKKETEPSIWEVPEKISSKFKEIFTKTALPEYLSADEGKETRINQEIIKLKEDVCEALLLLAGCS